MATEAWFRNPHDYIKELVESNEYKIAWDRGLLVKKAIDPVKHALLYFGPSLPYRVLLVGVQGTAEYRPGDTLEKPSAVYPTWAYGDDSVLLEEMLDYPLGNDQAACSDMSLPPDERPVFGQEHRIVITEMPDTRSGAGRSFMRYLKGLQEEYPHAIIHAHGLYGWKTAFGMGLGAADVEPRTAAKNGRVHLPSGAVDKWERLTSKPQWAAVMGFKPSDLSIPRNRTIYNIKSAVWAGENYEELYKFKTRGEGSGDFFSSDDDHVPAERKSPIIGRNKAQDGDKLLCDSCSLQDKCTYFRIGSVCTVPGAEPVPLSRMFKTRDADTILDGLGQLMATNANRLERGLRNEEIDGELDPEVSKLTGQVFEQGVKLAKLLEPQRFSGGAKVQVNVGAGASASVSTANPRDLVAAAVRQLVQQGIPQEQITQEMIMSLVNGMTNPEAAPRAIQATVLERKDEPA